MNRPNEPFELDDALKQLDDQLQQALHIEPPTDLANRVYQATVDRIATPVDATDVIGENFESEDDMQPTVERVREALQASPPAGLSKRIYQATVDQLPQTQSDSTHRSVIGRISPTTQRWAMAAMVLICTSLALWMVQTWSPGTGPIVVVDINIDNISQTEVEYVLTNDTNEIEADLASISTDLDMLATALINDHFTPEDQLISDESIIDSLQSLEEMVLQF